MPLSNFGVVTPGRLYRSAQPTSHSWEVLRDLKLGIRAVLKISRDDEYPDLLEARECDSVLGAGIQYQAVRISQFAPSVGLARQTVESLERLQTIGPTLVHCIHGQDRTGFVIAARRLIVDHWPLARALQERALFGVRGLVAVIDRAITECLEQLAKEEAA